MIATTDTPRRRLAAAALMATLALFSACGGDDDDDGGGGGSRPGTVQGTGYEVSAPGGWKNEEDTAKHSRQGFEPDTILLGRTVEGYQANVNVIRETSLSEGLTVEQYVAAARRLLEQQRQQAGDDKLSAEPVGQPASASLDGEKAQSLDQVATLQGKRLKQRQVVALRDGVAYILTYSAPADRFDDQVGGLREIVSSWRWR